MANDVLAMNESFIHNALDKNYSMAASPVTGTGQLIDIELDSVPGYATHIDLSVVLGLNIAGTALPTLSAFGPWNFFRTVEFSLGGGPFQSVSPFFHYLREMVMNHGMAPDKSERAFPYSQQTEFSIPAVAAGENVWKFIIRIPLQTQYLSTTGIIPMGSSSVKARIRLTVQSSFIGADQYFNPLTGGTAATATISTVNPSFVQPNIAYLTTPATKAQVPTPTVGYVLNVQERATAFVGAGAAKTPIKFPDPFRYLRLWHIIIDGTGAPTTTAVTNFELDLAPGAPQYNYDSFASLQHYFKSIRSMYRTDLPTGVMVFDQWSGNDPKNPNGTQTIDGTVFQTLQTQLAVGAATNVASPAKIITYAEALSPINF